MPSGRDSFRRNRVAPWEYFSIFGGWVLGELHWDGAECGGVESQKLKVEDGKGPA